MGHMCVYIYVLVHMHLCMHTRTDVCVLHTCSGILTCAGAPGACADTECMFVQSYMCAGCPRVHTVCVELSVRVCICTDSLCIAVYIHVLIPCAYMYACT